MADFVRILKWTENRPDVNELTRLVDFVVDFFCENGGQAIDLCDLAFDKIDPERIAVLMRALFHVRNQVPFWDDGYEVAYKAAVFRGMDPSNVLYGLKETNLR